MVTRKRISPEKDTDFDVVQEVIPLHSLLMKKTKHVTNMKFFLLRLDAILTEDRDLPANQKVC
jgi:hypothetical protein